jgi:hypothetical protein
MIGKRNKLTPKVVGQKGKLAPKVVQQKGKLTAKVVQQKGKVKSTEDVIRIQLAMIDKKKKLQDRINTRDA